MSYSPYLFTKNHQYHNKPVPTSEYTYKKLPAYSLWRQLPGKVGLSLELDIRKRNHFTFEYKVGEVLAYRNRVIFNESQGLVDSLGNKSARPGFATYESHVLLNKVGFSYSRDYGKGIIRFSPLVGLTYAWIADAEPFEYLGGLTIEQTDHLYPSSEFTISFIERLHEHSSTFMGSLGMNFRFHSKKRELFALKLYYEQGFRILGHNQTIVVRNNKAFTHNFSYSYGSAFYVKLSVPIPIYDFDKHREK